MRKKKLLLNYIEYASMRPSPNASKLSISFHFNYSKSYFHCIIILNLVNLVWLLKIILIKKIFFYKFVFQTWGKKLAFFKSIKLSFINFLVSSPI